MTASSGMMVASAINSSSMRRSRLARAALFDLNDFHVADTEFDGRLRRPLAIALCEFAFGPGFQLADGGNEEPHGPDSISIAPAKGAVGAPNCLAARRPRRDRG